MSEGRICFILHPPPLTIYLHTRTRKFIGKAELHFASVTTDDEHKTRCDRQLAAVGWPAAQLWSRLIAGHSSANTGIVVLLITVPMPGLLGGLPYTL